MTLAEAIEHLADQAFARCAQRPEGAWLKLLSKEERGIFVCGYAARILDDYVDPRTVDLMHPGDLGLEVSP